MAFCDGTANSMIWCYEDSNACCTDSSNIPRHIIERRLSVLTSSTPLSTLSLATLFSISPSILAICTTSATTILVPLVTNSLSSIPGGGMSTGAKAGIGVGTTLRALALVGLGMYTTKLKVKLKAARVTTPPHGPDLYGTYVLYKMDGIHRRELRHWTKPAEFDASQHFVQETSTSMMTIGQRCVGCDCGEHFGVKMFGAYTVRSSEHLGQLVGNCYGAYSSCRRTYDSTQGVSPDFISVVPEQC